MFIRKKKINNKQYGYLVESVWTPKGSRQKVKAYVGRIHELKPLKNHDFQTTREDPQNIVKALIIWELEKHGFIPYPDNEQQLIKDFLIFNKNTLMLKEKNKEVVLKINEGYLCNYTLQQLLGELKKNPLKEEDQRKKATQLAEAFVSAGISIPQETFINIFQQITEKE